MSTGNTITLCDFLSTRFAPIQAVLMSHLDTADLIDLKMTNKALKANISKTLENKDYNIDQKLKPFFKDPKAFRSVQAHCDAILFGAFARRFFGRISVPDNTLNIGVNANLEAMYAYLETEGYVKKSRSNDEAGENDDAGGEANEEDDDGDDKAYSAIYTKTLPSGARYGIVVMSCPTRPILDAVFQLGPTTAELNFVTWNKACSLVPAATFLRKEAYLIAKLGRGIDELDDEDISVKSVHWDQFSDDKPDDLKTLLRLRRVGDRETWTIKLNTDGVTPSNVPDAILKSTTFQIRLSNEDTNGPTARYVVGRKCLFDHPVLKYRYLTADQEEPDEDVMPPYSGPLLDLKDHLNDATVIELSKLKPKDRPEGSDELLRGELESLELLGNFTPPQGWKYYDDELLKHLDKAWEAQLVMEEKEKKKAEVAAEQEDLIGMLAKLLKAREG